MRIGLTVVTLGAAATLLTGIMVWKSGWDLPPISAEQSGYRGTAMVQMYDQEAVEALKKANVVPPVPYEADPSGPKISEQKDEYKNVQVLGDLSTDQFNRFMAVITEWVAPEQGCNYCHNPENMADDGLYTKVVARRMIQMTRTINANWKPHVAETGVTCYTCHRGQPVPANYWAQDNGPRMMAGKLGFRNGQNVVGVNVGDTSLPTDALNVFLKGEREIRVHTLTALPSGNKATIMDTEWTYGLMMHMSESLGVNCTFCHNSRAFNSWDESPTQRVTAWHGIRMAREINNTYMEPLSAVFPANRKGPAGDVFKVGCSTCHNGVGKPLYGVSMAKDYKTELGGVTQ